MPRAVRSHSNAPWPFFAAKVAGSWATMLTLMLIFFSWFWIRAATAGKSSGVENVVLEKVLQQLYADNPLKAEVTLDDGSSRVLH